MASNQTQHLKLCQWEADDEVLRTEFNADNAKIDEAVATAQAAAEIAYSPENQPFAIGRFMGNDATTRTISLSFTPSAVLLITNDGTLHEWGSGHSYYYGGLTVAGASEGANGLKIVEGGFQVTRSGNKATNVSGMYYNYIAFR